MSTGCNPCALFYHIFSSNAASDEHKYLADYTVKDPRVHMDMTAPLSHYFISSSHNSYLSGNQLAQWKGCTDPIVNSLKRRCRVIELDTYDSNVAYPNQGPLVYHGGTATFAISFRDCIKAIAANAFIHGSEYPVIITFENHCDEVNQTEMAEILKEELKELLFIPDPKEVESEVYRSPESLKGKVVLRSKRSGVGAKSAAFASLIYIDNTKYAAMTAVPPPTGAKSASLAETKLEDLVKPESAPKVLALTQKHLLRIYPGGHRVDSSNYNPFVAWSIGAQVVALNWQSWDTAVRCNVGLFTDNASCGYLLKPDWMRDGEPAVPARSPTRLLVKVLSAKDNSDRDNETEKKMKNTCCMKFLRNDLFVKASLRSFTGVTKFATTVKHNTKSIAKFDEEFAFDVHYPELSVLLLQLYDQDMGVGDDLIGWAAVPVQNLNEGNWRFMLSDSEGVLMDDVWIKAGLKWGPPPTTSTASPALSAGQAMSDVAAEAHRTNEKAQRKIAAQGPPAAEVKEEEAADESG